MRKRIFFIALSILLGMLTVLQIRSFQKVRFLVQRSEPRDILAELRILQLANEELRAQVQEEEKLLKEISANLNTGAIEDEILRLRLLSGGEEVFGKGVEITLSAPVKEFWLNDLTAQLVFLGAEAISVNDIRLVSQTAGFRNVGVGILMRRYFLKPPFIIKAIGPSLELKQSLAQNGGILDRIEHAHPGLQITLIEKENVIIPKLPE